MKFHELTSLASCGEGEDHSLKLQRVVFVFRIWYNLSIRSLALFTMKNFRKALTKQGFTLIELLVVIAIIGVLVAVVLVSLEAGKGKGNDAAVKANLDTIRSEAELFASNNNNSFLPSGGAEFGVATCPAYNPSGTDMLSSDKVIADAVAEAVNRGNGSACYNSSSAWAIAVGLKSGGTAGDPVPDSWCIDSGGVGKYYTWGSGQTITDSINVSSCQ